SAGAGFLSSKTKNPIATASTAATAHSPKTAAPWPLRPLEFLTRSPLFMARILVDTSGVAGWRLPVCRHLSQEFVGPAGQGFGSGRHAHSHGGGRAGADDFDVAIISRRPEGIVVDGFDRL